MLIALGVLLPEITIVQEQHTQYVSLFMILVFHEKGFGGLQDKLYISTCTHILGLLWETYKQYMQ